MERGGGSASVKGWALLPSTTGADTRLIAGLRVRASISAFPRRAASDWNQRLQGILDPPLHSLDDALRKPVFDVGEMFIGQSDGAFDVPRFQCLSDSGVLVDAAQRKPSRLESGNHERRAREQFAKKV